MSSKVSMCFFLSILLVLAASHVASQELGSVTTGANETSIMDESHISCRVHVVNNTDVEATQGRTQSSVKVLQEANITDAAVVVQLTHPDVAALQISLTASSASGHRRTIVMKTPNLSARGGGNMVQTIFSDYAPKDFPQTATDAPYSGVYRPAEPLDGLVKGNGRLAGRGGSKGVWTLSIVDAREGESRALKLTGWELWLCGEAGGPLFEADNTTIKTFSAPSDSSGDGEPGEALEVTVTQKIVRPNLADVKTILESGETIEVEKNYDLVLSRLNERLSVRFVDRVQELLAERPLIAASLQSSLEKFSNGVIELPAALGYSVLAEANWQLATPEQMTKEFLDTVHYCYYDIYWCWKNTGLGGSLTVELANAWGESAGPLMAQFEDAYKSWVDIMAAIEDANPGPGRWADVLFYSVIEELYDAALLNAVYSVGETYFQTAVRLAIYLTPVRFSFNPRAAFSQLYNLVQGILSVVFEGVLGAQPFVVDGTINNSIDFVVRVAEAMVEEVKEVLELSTEGLAARAQMAANQTSTSADALLKSAEMLNDQFAKVLGSINPALGALYNTRVASPLRDVSSVMRQSQRSVEDYFREQNNVQVIAQEVTSNLDILGNITMTLVDRVAEAFRSVETAFDPAIPGPPPSEVLFQLGQQITGIIGDANAALNSLVPVEQLQRAGDILQDTVDALLANLAEASATVEKSSARASINKAMAKITEVS